MEGKKAGRKQVVIAGAGASGMCAAVLLARAGLSVTVLEKGKEPGKKLSMTGNGRCNLSNLVMGAVCYNKEAWHLVAELFADFKVEETIAFFRSIGILTRSEEGYLYPVAGEAQTVVNALVNAMKESGVRLLCGEQVKRVERNPEADGYIVRTGKAAYEAVAVVLAGGGLSGPSSCLATGDLYYVAEQLGMEVTKRYPALVRLRVRDDTLPQETGVRVYAKARFFADGECIADETGEVQITKDGISGIPVLQASANVAQSIDAGKQVSCVLDVFPDVQEEEMKQAVAERLALRGGKRTVEELLNGFANSRINEMVCKRFGISIQTVSSEVEEKRLEQILDCFRHLEIEIEAADDFRQAQATRGGVALSSLTGDLEAINAPGVYVTGELCDVDGRCGGYNLQWAWTSAMSVADSIAVKFGNN